MAAENTEKILHFQVSALRFYLTEHSELDQSSLFLQLYITPFIKEDFFILEFTR